MVWYGVDHTSLKARFNGGWGWGVPVQFSFHHMRVPYPYKPSAVYKLDKTSAGRTNVKS